MSSCTFSSLLLLTVLFFRYSAFGENSGNFTLHESPGYVGSTEWTAFSARAKYLWVCAHLLLDPVGRAGEAELVMWCCWALDEVRVFQALGTDGTLQHGVVRYRFSLWSWDFDSVFANLAGGGDLATGGSSRQPR